METLLANRFRALGTELGLTKCRTRRVGQITELYLYGRHALQMEIDWRENELFVYAVRLCDGKLPGPDVVYRYRDGSVCRTFLEEVYHAKRPVQPIRREEHLLQCLEFYEALIHRDSGVLLRFLDSMDERI
jgi:hypothetical protein